MVVARFLAGSLKDPLEGPILFALEGKNHPSWDGVVNGLIRRQFSVVVDDFKDAGVFDPVSIFRAVDFARNKVFNDILLAVRNHLLSFRDTLTNSPTAKRPFCSLHILTSLPDFACRRKNAEAASHVPKLLIRLYLFPSS